MDIQEMINTLKGHPDAHKIGMIATHLGVVRVTSREGKGVIEIDIAFDYDTIAKIIIYINNM